MTETVGDYRGFSVRPLWRGPRSEGDRLFHSPERVAEARSRAESALAEPFVGVTTDGVAQDGLFPLRIGGRGAVKPVEAARDFLDGLSADQRDLVLLRVDAPEWRKWTNAFASQKVSVTWRVQLRPGQP